ncbi:hypothetical protein [Sulfitobacter sp.]|uniref:hypothetical protein n=1 Tax=Sulfitobacter sp. TaxID=1903071 RepID=UPI0039E56543
MTRQILMFCLICWPAVTMAQAPSADAGPLSVIDWLGEQPKTDPRAPKRPLAPAEAPVSRSALPPAVTVTALGKGSPRAIGLVPADVTGLPQDLWAGSTINEITDRLDHMPDLHLPAARALFYRLLLAEATAPEGRAAEGDALALARVKALIDNGAVDPALSLIEQAGVATSADHFALWMQVSLLVGTEDRACGLLTQKPYLTSDYSVRIFCAARAGNWDTAALTLGSAQSLELLPPERLALLDRFLNPDLFEGEARLPTPRVMDAMGFRLFEAIGERPQTRSLPPAFSVVDLRDVAGWKAQLEAAERLTRLGALPDNRFLGIYSDREPAASGGIWDRVEALQRFDTALSTGSAEAVTKTLRPAWHAMQEAELEVSFAAIFADALQAIPLEGVAANLRDRISLLSPIYEAVAAVDNPTPERAFLAAIATGAPPKSVPDMRQADAIASAFTSPSPRANLITGAQNGKLGMSILASIALLEEGANGDTAALRDALSTLRALGLEDIARRAALQVLLLERS